MMNGNPVEEVKLIKLEGNQLLKSGEDQAALKKYYEGFLLIRGLDTLFSNGADNGMATSLIRSKMGVRCV